jgi:methanogenic corrinoid protein MtbC1
VVQALRQAGVTAPILVGGRAITDLDHARKLGADGWSGTDAVSAVAAVEAAADRGR